MVVKAKDYTYVVAFEFSLPFLVVLPKMTKSLEKCTILRYNVKKSNIDAMTGKSKLIVHFKRGNGS